MASRMSSTACSMRLSWMANPLLSQTLPGLKHGPGSTPARAQALPGLRCGDADDSGPETYYEAKVNPRGLGQEVRQRVKVRPAG